MKKLYDEISVDICKSITNRYSTSFSLGIHLLHKSLRGPIYSIYGYVRLADELVDSFHDFDKGGLLDKFTSDTFEAIRDGISLNPVLNAFQEVINKYKVDHDLIHNFLYSMRMDLDPLPHDQTSFEKYILGSAQVVGLMCLRVFVNGDSSRYDALKSPAMALGSAFQKVNFLRDLQADFKTLGRSYFPGVDVSNLTATDKDRIEKSIALDFSLAHEGIKRLPREARLGVSTAYIYYYKLYQKICSTTAEKILDHRIRISNYRKLILLPRAYIQSNFIR